MTVVAITGHRPEKLPTNTKVLVEQVTNVLTKLNPTMVHIGMAAGADLMVGLICKNQQIPYTAVRPWAGHVARVEDRELYAEVMSGAHTVVNTNNSFSYPGVGSYEVRNRYMVDHSDLVLAVWDGGKKGGTWRAVSYAFKTSKPLIQVSVDGKTVTEFGTGLF